MGPEPTSSAPSLTVGSITIEDGTAVVTGAVDDVNALLEINGALVDIDDAGNFLAVVDLDADVARALARRAPRRDDHDQDP